MMESWTLKKKFLRVSLKNNTILFTKCSLLIEYSSQRLTSFHTFDFHNTLQGRFYSCFADGKQKQRGEESPPRSRDNRVQEPGFESRHLASASRDSKYNKEFTLLKRLLNEELQNHLQRELSYSPEGSGWGTHVYLWRIHFDIWQN